MTQQQKDKEIGELIIRTDRITDLIVARLNRINDESGTILLYLQLLATQNQIIILNQTPVTNDIQNPLHY